MKILQFTSENFKRLSVVQITPEGHLIQITGSNAAGKTSVLDSIWAALGGKDAVPDEPIHAGKKSARIELKIGDNDGLKFIVERTFTGKDTYLTIKSPDGGKYPSPQKMMDELMGAIGFDPLIFMGMDAKQQFALLRKIVPLSVDIDALDRKRAAIFEARTALTRSVASAKARADAITVPDLPDEEPNLKEITDRLTGASEHNERVRREIQHQDAAAQSVKDLQVRVAAAEAVLKSTKALLATAEDLHEVARKVDVPQPIDAAAVRAELDTANRIAAGFQTRQRKIDAEAELTTLEREHLEKTTAITTIDATKAKALTDAKMPVDGLSFHVPDGKPLSDGTVVFKGHPLRQASGAEQLAVSAAIGAALNPKLRVLLCRDGSLLDKASLAALSAFAEKNDLQIFLEKVDESGEVGIVIEDGHVKGQEALVAAFLKEEAEGATKSADAATKPADAPPDQARQAKATAYLAEALSQLAAQSTRADCDKANATVKHMLRAFPELLAQQWAPAYLSRVKELSK